MSSAPASRPTAIPAAAPSEVPARRGGRWHAEAAAGAASGDAAPAHWLLVRDDRQAEVDAVRVNADLRVVPVAGAYGEHGTRRQPVTAVVAAVDRCGTECGGADLVEGHLAEVDLTQYGDPVPIGERHELPLYVVDLFPPQVPGTAGGL